MPTSAAKVTPIAGRILCGPRAKHARKALRNRGSRRQTFGTSLAPARIGMRTCACREDHRKRKRVVLTGGPGAGKTAVLELVRQSFCSHVHVLPEAAGILFTGGFPRGSKPLERM